MEKRIYTEKDIEGYWATYLTMHPSLLGERLTNVPDSLKTNFLRLYNDLNGNVDTTYRVSHDTLLLRNLDLNYDYFIATRRFTPSYQILFASEERLVLRSLASGEDITLYSLWQIAADSQSRLDSIICIPLGGGIGLKWTADSLVVAHENSGSMCRGCEMWVKPFYLDVESDEVGFNRMSELYSRIIRKDLLWGDPDLTQNDGRVNSRAGVPYYQLELWGNTGRARISINTSDPCIFAMLCEFHAFTELQEIQDPHSGYQAP